MKPAPIISAGKLSTNELSPAATRKNMACLVWMGSVFAMGWAEVMVVLNPLLIHYGASNTQIGLAQGTLIATLPGMLISPWITRRFHYKKGYLFTSNSLYLLPLAVIGVIVYTGAVSTAQTMIILIVCLMFLGQIAAGFGGLPNQEFFTACIPMRLRGRLAGISAGVGGFLGLVATWNAEWILRKLPTPEAYGVLLLLAWILCQVADSAILFAKERPTPVDKSPRPWSHEMALAFWQDKRFVKLSVVICLISPLIAQLGVFASAFAFKSLSFEPQMAAWLGMSAAGSRLLLGPLAGWLTDRWGGKPSLLGWVGAFAIGFLLLAILPGKISVFVAVSIAAVAYSGFSGAMNALTSGIPSPEHRAGHFTILGLGMVITNSIAPILCGRWFDAVSYSIGFATLSALTALAALFGFYYLSGLSANPEDYQ